MRLAPEVRPATHSRDRLAEETQQGFQRGADFVEKLRKCRFSSARHTGSWACLGEQTLVIGRRSSAREFFNKIYPNQTIRQAV